MEMVVVIARADFAAKRCKVEDGTKEVGCDGVGERHPCEVVGQALKGEFTEQ